MHHFELPPSQSSAGTEGNLVQSTTSTDQRSHAETYPDVRLLGWQKLVVWGFIISNWELASQSIFQRQLAMFWAERHAPKEANKNQKKNQNIICVKRFATEGMSFVLLGFVFPGSTKSHTAKKIADLKKGFHRARQHWLGDLWAVSYRGGMC